MNCSDTRSALHSTVNAGAEPVSTVWQLVTTPHAHAAKPGSCLLTEACTTTTSFKCMQGPSQSQPYGSSSQRFMPTQHSQAAAFAGAPQHNQHLVAPVVCGVIAAASSVTGHGMAFRFQVTPSGVEVSVVGKSAATGGSQSPQERASVSTSIVVGSCRGNHQAEGMPP